MKYLLPLILVLGFTSGCAVPDIGKALKEAIFGKPSKESKEFTNEDNLSKDELKARRAWCAKHALPTVKQKVRSLLGLGATLGSVMIIAAILAGIFAKVALDKVIKVAIAGLILIIVSILLDEYLVWILGAAGIIAAIVGVYYLRKNWERIKKMVDFTDEIKKQGHLGEDAVHAAAHKTIGDAGSKDREAIKAVVAKARA